MSQDVYVVIRLSVDAPDVFENEHELAATIQQSIDQGEITIDGMDVEESEVVGVYTTQPKP